MRSGPCVQRFPAGAIGSKIHVCLEFSSTHPFAENDAPPTTMALFPTVATPVAGRLTQPDGVVPGHGSLLTMAAVFVAG